MSIVLDGTNGITTPDLAVDTNTLFVDAANNRVGIGTSSPNVNLHLSANLPSFEIQATGADAGRQITGIANDAGNLRISTRTSTGTFVSNDYLIDRDNSGATVHAWRTGNVERARIDASGRLLVNQTSGDAYAGAGFIQATNLPGTRTAISAIAAGTTGQSVIEFANPNGKVGDITTSGTTTSYNTSSDYRLKEDVQPMVGASERVLALNPVNFAWKVDGTRVDGFLAHEAQAVVPEAVHGTKDEVDADGNPVYQGIDQSKLVPLLTAALQEALQTIQALEARVAALETPA